MCKELKEDLEFINLLRPVDYKWDMRESYRKEEPQIVFKPLDLKEDASDEDKAKRSCDKFVSIFRSCPRFHSKPGNRLVYS